MWHFGYKILKKRQYSLSWWLARRDWRSGGPRFKSHPRLTSQSWSSYQLNQLGSKVASDSTLKQLTTCGVSNTCILLYFIDVVFKPYNSLLVYITNTLLDVCILNQVKYVAFTKNKSNLPELHARSLSGCHVEDWRNRQWEEPRLYDEHIRAVYLQKIQQWNGWHVAVCWCVIRKHQGNICPRSCLWWNIIVVIINFNVRYPDITHK